MQPPASPLGKLDQRNDATCNLTISRGESNLPLGECKKTLPLRASAVVRKGPKSRRFATGVAEKPQVWIAPEGGESTGEYGGRFNAVPASLLECGP